MLKSVCRADVKKLRLTVQQKVKNSVTPAKAGVHNDLKLKDPRIRGDAKKEDTSTFYGFILPIWETIDVRSPCLGLRLNCASQVPGNLIVVRL